MCLPDSGFNPSNGFGIKYGIRNEISKLPFEMFGIVFLVGAVDPVGFLVIGEAAFQGIAFDYFLNQGNRSEDEIK